MLLVFGGTGFIGKNLIRAIHMSGRRAQVISRSPEQSFLDRHAPGVGALTIEQFYSDPRSALFDCDGIVYLASTSTPASNLETPWGELNQNVEPFMRLLKAVEVYNPTVHIVFLSSGGTVYGQTESLHKIKEDTPLKPISPYGLGKKLMEDSLEFFRATSELRVTTLRPANPIGIWQNSISQGVVGALLRSARSQSAFPMQGDGLAVRDYFSVADLCDAILTALENPANSVGKVFNVGSGEGCTVGDMVKLVEQVSGRKIEIVNVPKRSSDVDRVVLETSKIKLDLGWHAKTPLFDTVELVWRSQDS